MSSLASRESKRADIERSIREVSNQVSSLASRESEALSGGIAAAIDVSNQVSSLASREGCAENRTNGSASFQSSEFPSE